MPGPGRSFTEPIYPEDIDLPADFECIVWFAFHLLSGCVQLSYTISLLPRRWMGLVRDMRSEVCF